jgi:hypothetical protein
MNALPERNWMVGQIYIQLKETAMFMPIISALIELNSAEDE